MIKHIVMWKLKAEAEGPTASEPAAEIKRRLEALPAQIPQIVDLEVGFNFNPAAVAMDVCLYSTFESATALQAYQVHPAHVAVKDFIGTVVQRAVVVDYEV